VAVLPTATAIAKIAMLITIRFIVVFVLSLTLAYGLII
jgi:hypothetical protein